MALLTFNKLEVAPVVTVKELKTCLDEHATGGWSINPRVVKKIVEKVNPSHEDIKQLIQSASEGVKIQNKKVKIGAATEYHHLVCYLQEKLLKPLSQ